MKFQIDTNLKTIKLEEKVLLKEVLDIMKTMFPEDWKEYSIETNCIINWPYRQPYSNPYRTYIDYNSNNTNNLGFQKKTITTSYNSDTANIINMEIN